MWLRRVDAKHAQKKTVSFGAPKVSSVVLIVAGVSIALSVTRLASAQDGCGRRKRILSGEHCQDR